MSTNATHEVIRSLACKGKVCVLGGEGAAEVARLLAKSQHVENAIILEPSNIDGLKSLRFTGADEAFLRNVSTIVVIPDNWSEAAIAMAISAADTAAYVQDNTLFIVKGGTPNQAPVPLSAVA